jgi:predicted TIM-barrel fold metal-dependent hydrolase
MIIDGFTLFGSWPSFSYDHPIENLIGGLDRFKLNHVCALSSTGIFLDAASGNAATLAACQRDPRLVPIGVADPRVNGLEQVDFCVERGVRVMALFPETQGWSCDDLAARLVLQRIGEQNIPLLVEASRPGSASAILRAVEGLTVPLILFDVSLRTLTEAMAVVRMRPESHNPLLEALQAPISNAVNVLRARPETFLATRLLCGGDTIEYLVQELGHECLVFTSRFPISCFSSAFLTAKYAQISDEARSAVMGGNMARLLGV